jgi:agmatine deiminase
VGNYLNYLRTARVVVVPVYGVPTDEVVLGKIEELFAGVSVVPIPCTELAREGGVLNCVTWTARVSTAAPLHGSRATAV